MCLQEENGLTSPIFFRRQTLCSKSARSMRYSPNQQGWNPAQIGWTEIILWCLLALFICCMVGQPRPNLSNDSYQYLSATENLLHGNGLSTSIIHFDVERQHGRIPAPLTTFPPGYPIFMAPLGLIGINLEIAGFLVSLAGLVFLILLIYWAGRILELPANALRLTLFLFIGNGVAVAMAKGVQTESLFTALSFAAVTLIMAYLRDGRPAWRLPLGLALLGAATWVRYAGLFQFLAVAIYLLIVILARPKRSSVINLLWIGVPSLIIAALFARNIVLSGSWKGGNTRLANHGIHAGMVDFVLALWHLLVGGARLGILDLGFLVALLSAGAIVLIHMLSPRLQSRFAIPSYALLPAFSVVFYCVCMLYMSVRSDIDMVPRMLYPVLPWILLLFSGVLARCLGGMGRNSRRWAFAIVLLAAVTPYVILNAREIADHLRASGPDRIVRSQFLTPYQGVSLLEWFDHNVPYDAVIVAENGQATGYALKRRTISLVGLQYSNQHWEESDVRRVMERYGAEYLITYPGLDPRTDSVQTESRFLAHLKQDWEPGWLRVAAQNATVKIYRRIP